MPLLPSSKTGPFYALLVGSRSQILRVKDGRLTLTVADRLQTIIGYDRICVMDAGHIVEFDTPTKFFNTEGGIFRSMCNRSKISSEDIRRAAKFRETRMFSVLGFGTLARFTYTRFTNSWDFIPRWRWRVQAIDCRDEWEIASLLWNAHTDSSLLYWMTTYNV
jgi:hypothetical protein